MSTPAGRLVQAFGRPDKMAALYAPDVTWRLPRGLGRDPFVGREAVCAFNQSVWTVLYAPGCEVEILDEAGDSRVSAVRFIYRARLLTVQRDYENEYTVFVRADSDGIHEVNEAMDSAFLYDFIRGVEPGTSFRSLDAPEI